MLPIPKAKFFDRKVPSGVNRQDFEEEIIEKQAHVLQSAISRVSLSHIALLSTCAIVGDYKPTTPIK